MDQTRVEASYGISKTTYFWTLFSSGTSPGVHASEPDDPSSSVFADPRTPKRDVGRA